MHSFITDHMVKQQATQEEKIAITEKTGALPIRTPDFNADKIEGMLRLLNDEKFSDAMKQFADAEFTIESINFLLDYQTLIKQLPKFKNPDIPTTAELNGIDFDSINTLWNGVNGVRPKFDFQNEHALNVDSKLMQSLLLVENIDETNIAKFRKDFVRAAIETVDMLINDTYSRYNYLWTKSEKYKQTDEYKQSVTSNTESETKKTENEIKKTENVTQTTLDIPAPPATSKSKQIPSNIEVAAENAKTVINFGATKVLHSTANKFRSLRDRVQGLMQKTKLREANPDQSKVATNNPDKPSIADHRSRSKQTEAQKPDEPITIGRRPKG